MEAIDADALPCGRRLKSGAANECPKSGSQGFNAMSNGSPSIGVGGELGKTIMRRLSLCVTATSCFVALAGSAHARSAYDGSWDLVFVTQRGACDPAYNFTVNVSNGVVTHPNLVKFRGYVARSGTVRASVTVQDKYASGSSRLSGASGRGTWRGHAGNARCSGYWTAHRN
jgi:hypothetical protein